MVLMFDLLAAQPAADSKFHGGGEYTKALLKRIIERGHSDELVVFYDDQKFIDDWVLEMLKTNQVKTVLVKDRFQLKQYFNSNHVDVYYSSLAYYDVRKFVPNFITTIGTVHGLRSLELANVSTYIEYDSWIKTIKEVIKKCIPNIVHERMLRQYKSSLLSFDCIITVSNHTKYMIKSVLPDIENINVYYTPAKYCNNISSLQSLPIVNEKYILLVSVNRPEKNAYGAIKALDSLLEKNEIDYKIVTVGGLSKTIKKKIKNKSRFIEFGYVDSDTLENLYANCDIFIYPSLSEGFGMPPLEAMKYGKTSCVSSITSMPEVCGDAVYYFNPYSLDEIKSRILMAVDHKIEKNKIVERFKYISERQEEDLDKLSDLLFDSSFY